MGWETFSEILVNIRTFQPLDEPAVIPLWEKCDLLRSWNDPRRDIRRKLEFQPDMFWGNDRIVLLRRALTERRASSSLRCCR